MYRSLAEGQSEGSSEQKVNGYHLDLASLWPGVIANVCSSPRGVKTLTAGQLSPGKRCAGDCLCTEARWGGRSVQLPAQRLLGSANHMRAPFTTEYKPVTSRSVICIWISYEILAGRGGIRNWKPYIMSSQKFP